MRAFTRSLTGGAILPLPKTDDSASVRADPGPQVIRPTPYKNRRFDALAQGFLFMASAYRLVGRTLGALALAVVVLAAPSTIVRAQESDPVVARANGVDIRQSDLALAEDEVGASMPQMPPDQKREYLITYLADIIVLSQAADQQKLGDRDDVKHRIALERNKVLMEALLDDVGKAAVTDDAMHKVYDDAVKQMAPEEEVRARHILVATEDEAKDIEAQLKKGADFATLAKEKSKDPGAAEGGDLGYFTRDQMVPEFADAAFKLDKGQISDPVKTQFGWHIIKVEDKRIKPTPTYDEVKTQLETFVAHKAQADLVQKLRSAANIERLDQPPPPAADPSSLNPAAPAKK
jgi:peptidyl-prolyl cis-trans isomerase C